MYECQIHITNCTNYYCHTVGLPTSYMYAYSVTAVLLNCKKEIYQNYYQAMSSFMQCHFAI